MSYYPSAQNIRNRRPGVSQGNPPPHGQPFAPNFPTADRQYSPQHGGSFGQDTNGPTHTYPPHRIPKPESGYPSNGINEFTQALMKGYHGGDEATGVPNKSQSPQLGGYHSPSEECPEDLAQVAGGSHRHDIPTYRSSLRPASHTSSGYSNSTASRSKPGPPSENPFQDPSYRKSITPVYVHPQRPHDNGGTPSSTQRSRISSDGRTATEIDIFNKPVKFESAMDKRAPPNIRDKNPRRLPTGAREPTLEDHDSTPGCRCVIL
ncbi:hypothetical protein FRC03_002871 [Tulasnella sp. 419]|nr:hypothetical protein FRC03_002871 [Tulasnella sp. 419]